MPVHLLPCETVREGLVDTQTSGAVCSLSEKPSRKTREKHIQVHKMKDTGMQIILN